MTRREQLFLLWATAATGLAIAFAVLLVVLALPRSSTRFAVGRVDDFPPGSFTLVNLPADFVDPVEISITAPKAWIVRSPVADFAEFFARTTVHGNPVKWLPESNHFEDAQLGNKWNRDGQYLEGPDQRDLDRFPVIVENGQVLIDLHLIKGVTPTPSE